MGLGSSIEWTEATWNPVTGCSKVSLGCLNCYAERFAKRLQAMGYSSYKEGFRVAAHPELLNTPLEWKKPQTIFVNSMSDLFHEDVPDDFIFEIFKIMKQAHWHRFQILTKRSRRLKKLNSRLLWASNIWMGVSVEDEDNLSRINDLKKTDASLKFISFEPLLSPLPKLDLRGINWIIVGGESGPKARKIDKSWVVDILEQSKKNDIPFFFKQWGGFNKKKAGRVLEGRTWDERPL